MSHSLARIEAMLESLIVACVRDPEALVGLAQSLAGTERRTVKCKRCKLAEISNKLDQVLSLFHLLEAQGIKIMATQADLTKKLTEVNDKLVKIAGETTTLLQLITDLKAQLANAPVSAELQAAFDKVAAQAQVVDDLVPDAPTP